jgi:hypothetical protein
MNVILLNECHSAECMTSADSHSDKYDFTDCHSTECFLPNVY